MVSLLNLGSLILGLIAWIFPVLSLTQYRRARRKNWFAFSAISLIACAVSLYMQLCYNRHLVIIGDWSALMDTTGAVVFAATVLLLVTIVLNAVTLAVYRHKADK
jgi:cytochrome c oxidase subunit 4